MEKLDLAIKELGEIIETLNAKYGEVRVVRDQLKQAAEPENKPVEEKVEPKE